MFTILVNLGCYSKTPQTGWLIQQKSIFSHFQRLDIQDQAARRCGFPKASLLLIDCHLLSVSSHSLLFCVLTLLLSLPLLIRTLVLLNQDPTSTTSFILNYIFKDFMSKIQSHWGLRRQLINCRRGDRQGRKTQFSI